MQHEPILSKGMRNPNLGHCEMNDKEMRYMTYDRGTKREQLLGKLIHVFVLFSQKVKSQLSLNLKGENVTTTHWL